MATWRAALYGRMTGLASGRVYRGFRPQNGTLPALVWAVVDDAMPQQLKGFDLAPARVQFDTYAATPEAASTLMDSVVTTMVPGGTFSGHDFQRAEVALGPRDLVELVAGTPVYRQSMDLIFYHAEVVPAS